MGDVTLLDRVKAEVAGQKSDIGLKADEQIGQRPDSYRAWTHEGHTD